MPFLPRAWSFHRMSERQDFADYWILSRWLQVQVPISPVQNIPVREMMESHSELGLVIRLVFSVIASGVHHSMECELQ